MVVAILHALRGLVDAPAMAVQRHPGGAAERDRRLDRGEEHPLAESDGIPAANHVAFAPGGAGQFVAADRRQIPSQGQAVTERRALTAGWVLLCTAAGA